MNGHNYSSISSFHTPFSTKPITTNPGGHPVIHQSPVFSFRIVQRHETAFLAVIQRDPKRAVQDFGAACTLQIVHEGADMALENVQEAVAGTLAGDAFALLVVAGQVDLVDVHRQLVRNVVLGIVALPVAIAGEIRGEDGVGQGENCDEGGEGGDWNVHREGLL